jgi:hypothetical protein
MRRALIAAGLALGVATTASPALANIRTGAAERPPLDVRPIGRPVAALPSAGAFLTGPSRAPAASIARSYLSSHAGLLGTTAARVASLVQTRDTVDAAGLRQVSLAQKVDGIPVFRGGVKVNIAPDGQVINVVGAPVSAATPGQTTPGLSATAALGVALADGGGSLAPPRASTDAGPERETAFSSGRSDSASLVYFDTGRALRLAWHVYAQVDSQHIYEDVVDASSGDLLFRENGVKFAGRGLRWSYLPSYTASFPYNGGGLNSSFVQPGSDDFVGLGWLTNGATTLSGTNAHVYADTPDDNTADPGDEIAPGGTGLGAGDWGYTLASTGGSNCSVATPCTWNSASAYSWTTNLAQNATQVFYYVNLFHDHLAAAPIGFTAADGSFDGGDALLAEVDDGAARSSGKPDGNHKNNANMWTPPDGQSPAMQMYLFTGGAPIVDSNAGDDASIVFHEYTHGLTNRLVTNANGEGALSGAQPGAMGEAWSDWYALDFIVKACTEATPRPTDCWDADLGPNATGSANLWIGRGIAGGPNRVARTQPIDCLVNDGGGVSPIAGEHNGPVCPGGTNGRVGGYTYADFGDVVGGPEVHADGEIWAETLWQIRQAIGPQNYQITENIVTRGLELTPPEPTFLDARNAILEADQVLYGGAHVATLWTVFAQRGMGYAAYTGGPNDTQPQADFNVPPPPAPPAPPTSDPSTTPSSSPSTTAPPTTTGQSTPPPPPPPLDRTAPVVSQNTVAKQSLRTILASGVKVWFSCSEACTVRETLKLSAAQAKKLKLGKRAIVLGSGVQVLASKGSVVVPVKLTARGRSLVRSHRSLPLTSSASVSDANGNTRTSTRVFTLRRS